MASPLDAEAAYYAALETARERSAALVGPSLIDRIVALPKKERDVLLDGLSVLDLARLRYDWDAWARPKQNLKRAYEVLRPSLAPAEDFLIVLMLMGRGFGKSRSGAERIRQRVCAGAWNIGLVGPTVDDIERYMLGYFSDRDGLLNVFPPSQRPKYYADKHAVKFHTGATAYVHSAEKAEFRGASLDTVWCDELAMWRHLEPLFFNIEKATREPGPIPSEILITTTPLPLQFLKDLVRDRDCLTIGGSLRENVVNLDERRVDRLYRKFEGTRQGAQELEGEILGDNPDSLFPSSVTDAYRVDAAPEGLRTIVSVDCAINTTEKNDATGILVMGDDLAGHIYVLADLSGRHKPDVWGKLVVEAYDAYDAIAIVVERNRGGDLVARNIRASMERRRGGVAAEALRIEEVHASKGKAVRAEPVSTLHAKGMIRFVGRAMKEAEAEISEWNPKFSGTSPDRLDALVWGAHFLGNLSAEGKPDPMIGMRGLGAANAILQRPRSEPMTPPTAVTRSPGATAQRRAVARTVRRTI